MSDLPVCGQSFQKPQNRRQYAAGSPSIQSAQVSFLGSAQVEGWIHRGQVFSTGKHLRGVNICPIRLGVLNCRSYDMLAGDDTMDSFAS